MTTPSGPALGQAATARGGAGQPAPGPPRYAAGPLWARYLPAVAALAISFWGITTPSYWRDEAATLAAIRRPFGDLLTMLGNVDAVHAVYYMIMWVVVRLAGTGELAMRFPSALAVAVAAAAVAAIGRRLVSPRAGLAAGLLFAVLPVAGRYGQEARSYAMVIAMAAVTSYLLVRVTGADPARRGRWLAAYGLSLAALGALNIFALLLIPAHAITVALWWRRGGAGAAPGRLAAGWAVAVAAALLVSGPQLALGWMQRGQISWLAVNKSSSGLGTLLTLIGSRLVTLLVVALIVAGVLASAPRGAAGRSSAWPAGLWELAVPWLVVPPVLLLAGSVITPVYTTRYVLLCVPALALLGGTSVAAIGELGRTARPGPAPRAGQPDQPVPAGQPAEPGRPAEPVAGGAPGTAGGPAPARRPGTAGLAGGAAAAALAAIAAVLAIALAGLPAQVASRRADGHYDNIRALDQYVSAHAKPGDVVLYTNPNAESFGAAYSGGLGALPNIELAEGPVASGTLAGTNVRLPELRRRLARARRVWVVEINKIVLPPQVLGLDGRPKGPAFSGLPFTRALSYRARGDWLLLFTRN